jgi:hypothetical protein
MTDGDASGVGMSRLPGDDRVTGADADAGAGADADAAGTFSMVGGYVSKLMRGRRLMGPLLLLRIGRREMDLA